MKKILISGAALLIAVSSFGKSRPKKSSPNFYQYVAKEISNHSSFAKEGLSGTIKVKVTITSSGIESAYIVAGLDEKIDQQIIELIKNAPLEVTSTVANADDKTVLIVPVKLVVLE